MFGGAIFCLPFQVFFIFQITQSVSANPEPEPGFSHLAKNAFGGGVEIAKSSPFVPVQVKAAVIVGSAVVEGVNQYRKTGDIKSAGAVAAKSGLNDAAQVVNNVPGAKLAMGLAKDVATQKNMSTIISNRIYHQNSGNEALNIVPGVPVKELASIGLSAAQAKKDGKSIEDIVKQSAQETLTVYAKDHPMFNQVQKYSDLSENELNLLPQTSSQASNGGRASENAEGNGQSSTKEGKSRKSRSTDSVLNQQGNCICEQPVQGLKSIKKRRARAVRIFKRSKSKSRGTTSNRMNENNNNVQTSVSK